MKVQGYFKAAVSWIVKISSTVLQGKFWALIRMFTSEASHSPPSFLQPLPLQFSPVIFQNKKHFSCTVSKRI